jgi:ABC-type transport system involved in multi-copper enzyme maturation permease subunit
MIDALRFEWVRLTTIRSTYWLLGIALGVQFVAAVLLTLALGSLHDLGHADVVFSWVLTGGASIGIGLPLISSYLTGALGVLSVGHEYRYGTLRGTLTAQRSRAQVLAAKVLTTGALAAGVGLFSVVTTLLSFLVAGVSLPEASAQVDLSVGVITYLVLFTWWGVAVATLLRGQTAAIAVMLIVPTVVEWMVKTALIVTQTARHNTHETSLTAIAKFLPFDAGSQMYVRQSVGRVWEALGIVPFGALGGGVVMAAFVGVLLIWALAAFSGRDA